MKYTITLQVEHDDPEVIADLIDIIERIAPYMTDNVVVTSTSGEGNGTVARLSSYGDPTVVVDDDVDIEYIGDDREVWFGGTLLLTHDLQVGERVLVEALDPKVGMKAGNLTVRRA